MRSLVTFEIEHGDTTDPLVQFIDDAMFGRPEVTGYKVNVDLPPCFVLDSGN